VSNHGGRQIEALVPSIDVLPAIVSAVVIKATVLLDSGVRSGEDVMRALALGANAAFAGKSFLWAVAALGDDGPDYLITSISANYVLRLASSGRALSTRRGKLPSAIPQRLLVRPKSGRRARHATGNLRPKWRLD